MNDSDTNVGTRQSVVAIVREDDVLKGVELRKRDGATEILWAKSTEDIDVDWQSFAAECDLSVKSAADEGTDSERTVVIGFGSAGTVFHRASVPPVEEQEIESIVQLQAETRLPLPSEQTELAWRADPAQNGQIGVTMVVARKELLREFVRDVRPLDPTRIILDCEGIIKAWRTVFSEYEEEAVVVSMSARSTQVCLARDGRLSNAVILDLGLEDLSGESPTERTETTEKIALDMGIDSLSSEAHVGQTEIAERFVRDMKSVMDLFGFEDPGRVPVLVLSDDSTTYVSIVSSLRSAELNARVVLPNVRTLASQGESGVQWIYDYRAAIGLGLMALEDGADELKIFENVYSRFETLMALEDGADELKIFENVYSRFETEQKKHWIYSPKVACAIAGVMLLLLAIVFYATDMKSPKAITARLDAAAKARLKAGVLEAGMDLDALDASASEAEMDLDALIKAVKAQLKAAASEAEMDLDALDASASEAGTDLDALVKAIKAQPRRKVAALEAKIDLDALKASVSEARKDLDALVQRQKLIRMVARERPDILALLKLITDSGERGVLLNGVSFKKDSKVSITGQVQSDVQLYKFQKTLDKNKDMTDVKITNIGRVSSKSGGGPAGRPGGPPSGGARGKGGITFTITFHYKNFTKKTARAQS
jgi:hypothetical protein